MKLLNKMSVKDVVGRVPTEIVEVITDGVVEKVKRGIEQHLVRLVGVAYEAKVVPTTFGESIGFIGQFEATNVLTGEIYRSAKCYLPDTATGQLLPMVKNNPNGVQFAFDVGVKPANTAHGYEYVVTPLVEVTNDDPLRALANTLLANAPALPAPKGKAQLALPNTEPDAAVEAKPKGKK